jgi:hypothetical protein
MAQRGEVVLRGSLERLVRPFICWQVRGGQALANQSRSAAESAFVLASSHLQVSSKSLQRQNTSTNSHKRSLLALVESHAGEAGHGLFIPPV